MGKLNEIQKQTTQSYGDNAFTTTIKDDTVEFDSLKDKFTFKDEVEVPSLKINGEYITPAEPTDPIPVKNGEGTGSVLIGNIDQNKAEGNNSVAEGNGTLARGRVSHAEGEGTYALGDVSHAEGEGTYAKSECSHAEGSGTNASGVGSHAEGSGTIAIGYCSHAEGEGTYASGNDSHAEGERATASGDYSHAEGSNTTASGDCSHAEGYNTKAGRKNQHVFGKYNVAETGDKGTEGTYVEIVGNGTPFTRSNVRTLDWNGNEVLSGTITANGINISDAISTVKFRVNGGTLQASIDGGTTWQTVTLS